jgi:uncharacterized cupin superfamily protein/nucleoside-diphosphate-sugar epimerase
MTAPLVIFGCGYIGGRLARAALAQGREVRVCARGAARLAPLGALGATVKFVDAARPKQFGPALLGLQHPTVLYAVPPVTELPPGEAVRRATQAAIGAGAGCFIYLSTTGMFGDHPAEDWVDEDTPTATDDPAMTPYHTDEAAVEGAASAGLRTVILRLAAVYGPGKGVRDRLAKNDYKLLDEGANWSSRVHVDDVVRIILAAEERAPGGALYMVADDQPTTQREYVAWLCERMHIPLPPSVKSYAPGAARRPHRGRRVRNARMKRDLGVSLLHPSYREGELQVETEERGEAPAAAPPPSRPAASAAPPAPSPVAPFPAAPSPAAPSPAAPPARPAFVQHVSALPTEAVTYTGDTEIIGTWTVLGEPLGLTRIGANLLRLAPGQRTSYPHAHSLEEELVYVLEGTPDLWIDGRLHRLAPGDVAGFPAGTGICHTVINNGSAEVVLLALGERGRAGDKVLYPLHPDVEPPGRERWTDAPRAADRGDHDGRPDAARRKP